MTCYNRDIAHCNGTDCLLAVSCKRYHLAVLAGDRQESENEPYVLVPWVAEAYANGKCPNYYRRDEYQTETMTKYE